MSGCANANETSAVVRRIEDGHAWVEVQQANCGQCAGQGGCGSGMLGLRSRPREYRILNTPGVRVGDTVMLSVEGGSVLRGALLAYALPLGLGLLGAAATTALGGGDWQAAGGLFAGIGIGWFLLRFMSGREPGTTISIKSPTIIVFPPTSH